MGNRFTYETLSIITDGSSERLGEYSKVSCEMSNMGIDILEDGLSAAGCDDRK